MSTEAQKRYWRDYYLAHRVLKNKPLVSKYRWKNDGHGRGIPTHIVIAQTVLGRTLPKGAHVHHVDGNGHNNEYTNLVICPSQAYHMLLHVRQRALEQCGNANWLRCIRCKKYDDPSNMSMYVPKDQTSPRAEHRECMKRENQKRRVSK